MKPDTHDVHFRLKPEAYATLKELAKAENRSVAYMCARAVRQWRSKTQGDNMRTYIKMRSGDTFDVPVFYEQGGLAVTPWIVVGEHPFPSKAHFAITQLRSGAVIVNTPYTRLPDAIYVTQQLVNLLDWKLNSYEQIEEGLKKGEYPELRDFLAEEVYQALVKRDEQIQRMVRRTQRENKPD